MNRARTRLRAYQIYGPQLLTNNSFDADLSGWQETVTGTGTVAWVAGTGTVQGYVTLNGNASGTARISQEVTGLVIGARYLLETYSALGGTTTVLVGTSENGSQILTRAAFGVDAYFPNPFTATATTLWVTCARNSNGIVGIHQLSLRRILGVA